MVPTIILIFGTSLLFYATYSLIKIAIYGIQPDGGSAVLATMTKWQRSKRSIWDNVLLSKILDFAERFVYLDQSAEEKLTGQISRAGLKITAKRFTTRKVVTAVAGAVLFALFVFLKSLYGSFLVLLITVYLIMRQSASLSNKIKEKDKAIDFEMPRFVKTVCQNLEKEKDIYNIISKYRKIAGKDLGAELDILLGELATGNAQTALAHFQNRLHNPNAFLFCAALQNVSLGIDQTSTLIYLGNNMSTIAKENMRKEYAKYPGKMKRSMLPAVIISAASLLYVLIVYTISSFTAIV